jgi:hypothetical protein
MAIIGDNFTNTNGTTLASHVATGPNGGFTWLVVQSGAGLTIEGNQLHVGASQAVSFMRADVNLGNADQEGQFTVVSWNEGINRVSVGVMLRKDSSATRTFYWADLNINNGNHSVKQSQNY